MPHIYHVPFANSHLSFEVPSSWTVDVAESTMTAQSLPPTEIEKRLHIFAQQLLHQHDPARKLIFVFTDATRASPDQILLEPITRYLQPHNLDIEFICAIGMHRPSTTEEKVAKLGQWIVGNFPVIDHVPAEVVQVGEIDGIPIEMNPRLLNATVVGVGVVEPHQYAGYSGGAKTAVIGCGGATTIGITHGTRLLENPATRLGKIEGNPFQNLLRQAGALIEHHWAVNVVLNADYEILELAAGRPNDVHNALVAKARQLYEVPAPNAPYDVAVAGIGAPKDANLYQATRGATYLGLSADPIIRRGGVIIVPASLPEGGGQGRGERNFMQLLHRFGPTGEMLDYLRENGCRAGDQRAFMVAQLRQDYRLIIVGSPKHLIFEANLDHAPTMDEALYAAQKMVRTDAPKLLIVPHSLQTLPIKALNA